MSLTIKDIYTYAKLATAGYVDLSGAANFDPATLAALAAGGRSAGGGPQTPRMPTKLGEQFFVTDDWRVVGDPRYSFASHNDPAGFAATLFQQGAGQKVLSIRGTEPSGDQLTLDLFKADLSEIGLLGIAISQTVGLFNLVQRLKAQPGELGVQQLALRVSFVPPTTGNFVAIPGQIVTYYSLERAADAVGVGGISPGDSIAVVGHSLGGHLAAMATRLFSGTFSSAVVFNSARYDPPTSAGLTESLLNLFGQFGATPTAAFSNVSMFDSEDEAPGDDISVVSSLITGKLFGPLITVTTEANSHVIEPFADSLALQALMFSMNTSLTLADTGKVVEAISRATADTDERLLQAVHRLLTGNELIPLTTTQAGLISASEIQARQQFHSGVVALEGIVNTKPALHFDSLIGFSASDLANAARNADAIAYRYALRELNPFVISGDDTVYDQHNLSGTLKLFGIAPVSRTLP